MEEHDGATAWVAGLNRVELYTTAACDLVFSSHPPLVALLPIPCPFRLYSPPSWLMLASQLRVASLENPL